MHFRGKMINYLFVVNPIAGGNDKTSFYEFLEREVNTSDFSYEVYETKGSEDETALKKLIRRRKPEIVIAIGGDGTLLLVAKLLINSSTKIGHFPFGSANGMAKELNIPKVPEITLNPNLSERYGQNWSKILKADVREIDILKINKRIYSIHLSDLGLNAKIVKRFEEEKIRGYFGYARLFIKELKQRKRISYKLMADGKKYHGKGYMIVIANATKYGTGAVINPVGNLSDGRFEICIVRQIKLISLLRSLVSIFNINMKKREDLMKVISCRKARLELKKPETLQVDGEVIGEVKKLEISIIPRALKMMV